MALRETIAQLEREQANDRLLLTEVAARVHGREAQLRSLRAGLGDPDALVGLDRTEAVLTVLRRSERSLGPKAIAALLEAQGRDDSAKLVGATLSYLLEQDRVTRPAPGRYLAL